MIWFFITLVLLGFVVLVAKAIEQGRSFDE